jgi:hypothetical protein
VGSALQAAVWIVLGAAMKPDQAILFFRNLRREACLTGKRSHGGETMDGLIYLIGLIVVIMAILSFFGLR